MSAWLLVFLRFINRHQAINHWTVGKRNFILANMKSFLDPKIEAILADKSDTQRIQAIAFSIACLLNGPTAFQPPDFYHIPKRSGKKKNVFLFSSWNKSWPLSQIQISGLFRFKIFKISRAFVKVNISCYYDMKVQRLKCDRCSISTPFKDRFLNVFSINICILVSKLLVSNCSEGQLRKSKKDRLQNICLWIFWSTSASSYFFILSVFNQEEKIHLVC